MEMNRQTTTTEPNTEAFSSALDDFSAWKEFLGSQLDRAQNAGMSDKQIDDVAFRLGNFLADKVDPKNVQQRLLKQMWDVSSKEDQRVLARIMVDLVERSDRTGATNPMH